MSSTTAAGVKYNLGLQRFTDPYRSYDAALKTGKSIWVLNNSIPKSLLIITITDPLSGRPKTLDFPRTFIPFCLSDMVPREILERSLELRNFVKKGVLKMIPEEEAMALIGSPEGQEEYARLNDSEFADSGNGISVRAQELERSMAEAALVRGRVAAVGETKPQPSNLHPMLKIWEDLVSVKAKTTADLLGDLRIHASELTEADCDYLQKGKYPAEVRKWAKEKVESGGALKNPIVTTEASTAAKSAVDDDYEADFEIEVT